jgi:hypothetical protein
MEEEQLTGKIIGCAMKVHSVLGPGFFEAGYPDFLYWRGDDCVSRCKSTQRPERSAPNWLLTRSSVLLSV